MGNDGGRGGARGSAGSGLRAVGRSGSRRSLLFLRALARRLDLAPISSCPVSFPFSLPPSPIPAFLVRAAFYTASRGPFLRLDSASGVKFRGRRGLRLCFERGARWLRRSHERNPSRPPLTPSPTHSSTRSLSVPPFPRSPFRSDRVFFRRVPADRGL